MSGSKSLRYLGWPVIESAPSVRPWKEFSSETISYFSGEMSWPWAFIIFMRAFGGFGAAVSEEGTVEAADFGNALRQRPLVFVVKKIGSVDQARGLLLDHPHDARMILAESIHPDTGDEVEIAFARSVPHVRTVATHQNERMTRVVLEQILTLKVDDVVD